LGRHKNNGPAFRQHMTRSSLLWVRRLTSGFYRPNRIGPGRDST
jgi:hypothetical protein